MSSGAVNLTRAWPQLVRLRRHRNVDDVTVDLNARLLGREANGGQGEDAQATTRAKERTDSAFGEELALCSL